MFVATHYGTEYFVNSRYEAPIEDGMKQPVDGQRYTYYEREVDSKKAYADWEIKKLPKKRQTEKDKEGNDVFLYEYTNADGEVKKYEDMMIVNYPRGRIVKFSNNSMDLC